MSNDIRKILNHLMELDINAKRPGTETDDDVVTKVDTRGLQRDNTGRINHQDISYDVDTTKVIAHLQSFNSQVYTKMAQNLKRIDELEAEVKKLKEETKAQVKTEIADLFAAEDTARTRVVETVSFIFELTKDPKATESPKYKDILETLSASFTPELMAVYESLKKTMVTVTQKSPALKVNAKESINEGVWDQLKGFVAGVVAKVQSWANKYDSKLANLKAQAGMAESVSEAEGEVEESVDFNRVERIEKQVDFMVGRGRSRQDIVDNIAAKMGEEEAEHAGLYFDEFHKQAAMESAKVEKAKSLYGFKYQNQQEKADEKQEEVAVEESLEANDFDSLEESLRNDYLALMEGNFKVGDTVYCGSRKGTVTADQIPGKEDVLVVELPSGERDVFPKARTIHGDPGAKAENPGMLRRAMSWVVGEEEEVTEAPYYDDDAPYDDARDYANDMASDQIDKENREEVLKNTNWDESKTPMRFASKEDFIQFLEVFFDQSIEATVDGFTPEAKEQFLNNPQVLIKGNGEFEFNVPTEFGWEGGKVDELPQQYRQEAEEMVSDLFDHAMEEYFGDMDPDEADSRQRHFRQVRGY